MPKGKAKTAGTKVASPASEPAPERPAKPTSTVHPGAYIVDDHPLVRTFLGHLLESKTDLRVIGWSEDASHAREEVAKLRPALIILDLTLAGSHGLELIKDLRSLNVADAILVFSQHDELLYAERVLEAGALGYLKKTAGTEQILTAIRTVMNGEVYLSPEMTARTLRRNVGARPAAGGPLVATLSDRELQVFESIGQGLETKQIAAQLKLDIKTVETYRARIKDKLGLHSAPALMRAAFQWVNHGAGA